MSIWLQNPLVFHYPKVHFKIKYPHPALKQQNSTCNVHNMTTYSYDIRKTLYLKDPWAASVLRVERQKSLVEENGGREAEHEVLINIVKSLPGPLSSL